MADRTDRVIALLESIDASLKVLTARKLADEPKPIATDRDLDSKFGDPVLKFNPRDWTGPSYKNRRFSECPADLLDQVAQAYDWFAEQADQNHEMTNSGKPVATYKLADAARARGWAKRIRDGKHMPSSVPTTAAADPEDDSWGNEQDSGWT